MHPAFLACGSFHEHHHKHHHHGHHHKRGRCGSGHHAWAGPADDMSDDALGGGFGVRRPLRFLAHQLNLDDRQVADLARILDQLKTERAQAEVDRRRTLASFADAVTGDHFDETLATEAGSLRVQSAERLRTAVLTALRQIHTLLQAEQRAQLAYLIRTGTLTL